MEKKAENETKEKMIKTCKILKWIINILKWLVVLGTISAIVTPFIIVKHVDESQGETIGNEIIKQEGSEIVKSEETEKDWRIFPEILLTFSIILCIEKILKEIIEKETPFTEKSIKMMKLIGISSIALSVLTKGVSIVFALSIVIIIYIFKYGYQLQIESDETL